MKIDLIFPMEPRCGILVSVSISCCVLFSSYWNPNRETWKNWFSRNTWWRWNHLTRFISVQLRRSSPGTELLFGHSWVFTTVPYVLSTYPLKLITQHDMIDIDDFAVALDSVFQGKATILNRMRLACTFYNQDESKKSDQGDGRCLTHNYTNVSLKTRFLQTGKWWMKSHCIEDLVHTWILSIFLLMGNIWRRLLYVPSFHPLDTFRLYTQLIFLYSTVGWFNRLNSHWFHSLLSLSWRTNRAPVSKRTCADANLSKKSIV